MSSADYLAAGAARMAVLDKRIDWSDTSDEKPAPPVRQPKPIPVWSAHYRTSGELKRVYEKVRKQAHREIRCASQERCFLLPRQMTIWLQHRLTGASLQQLARFWMLHHTTVLAAIRKIDLLRESDQAARLLTDWWLRKLAAVDALDAARRQA